MLTVVLYHNVADGGPAFEADLGVSTRLDVFQAHLDYYRANYDIVDLDAVQNGPLPRNALLITFDDVYRSVLAVAEKLLSPMGIPAVFFVNPGLLGRHAVALDAALYWYARKHGLPALCHALAMPQVLSVNDLISGPMAALGAGQRTAIRDRLLPKHGAGDGAGRSELDDRSPSLEPDDLARLPPLGIEIGNHTMSHVHCRALSDDEQHPRSSRRSGSSRACQAPGCDPSASPTAMNAMRLQGCCEGCATADTRPSSSSMPGRTGSARHPTSGTEPASTTSLRARCTASSRSFHWSEAQELPCSGGQDMSLLIITGNDPEHRYVANRIARAHPVTRVLVMGRRRRRSWHKMLRKGPPVFLDKALLHVFLRLAGDAAARQRALYDVLGEDMCAEFHEPEKLVYSEEGRGTGLARIVADSSPDVIAVYGTGIIPDDVLGAARVAALNMHTGLSPRYRGTSCAFWPIHDRSPQWVGATVHACTSVLDGGDMHATRRAPLFRGDDLHRIFARAVRAGAEAYVEVLHDALSGTLTGAPQDLSAGREYRGSMRGIRAELLARWRLSGMQREWPVEQADAALTGAGGGRAGCSGADGR